MGAGCSSSHLDVRVSVCSGIVPDEHAVALAEVTSALSRGLHLHEAAVGVRGPACRDPLGHDFGAGAGTDVNHLSAGVSLLRIVCERDRVELPDGVVALENHGRVLPRDGAAGLHLHTPESPLPLFTSSQKWCKISLLSFARLAVQMS
jgi:hypothetical protein